MYNVNSLTEEIKMKGAFPHKTGVQRMHKETIRLLIKFKQNYNSFQELV
jgi:hypothetical protein